MSELIDDLDAAFEDIENEADAMDFLDVLSEALADAAEDERLHLLLQLVEELTAELRALSARIAELEGDPITWTPPATPNTYPGIVQQPWSAPYTNPGPVWISHAGTASANFAQSGQCSYTVSKSDDSWTRTDFNDGVDAVGSFNRMNLLNLAVRKALSE
jgi:hypothetical protein